MATVHVGRNDLCPCGSGRKFKRCCSANRAIERTGSSAFEMPRPIAGDDAEGTGMTPQRRLERRSQDNRPINRIPVHYTYAEPFGEAECIDCFPVENPIILAEGNVVPAEWLQPGMRFRMEDGALGLVTAVEPARVLEPPSWTPDRHDNDPRRVLGTIKHQGFVVLDVTFGGQTVTTTPDHLFCSGSRGAWVPVGSMRPGERLRNDPGGVTPIEATGPSRDGVIERYNLEVEEPPTFFVGAGASGSALVHNGKGDDINKPAVPTEADHIKAVQAPGRYNATVGSEEEARRILQTALPHATEVPRAVPGQTYPQPGPGVKAWYQVQPPEPDVGNNLPHVKYEDWTGGKKFKGGR